ncbi:DUF2339 domain-containing protein, partial [Candidatus Gracilibacteria bacterium]|nr:DUF2339 domain-containing protein [Candidatus Gracilibacteria bacterium]
TFKTESIQDSIETKEEYDTVTQIGNNGVEVVETTQDEDILDEQLHYNLAKQEAKIEKVDETPGVLGIYLEQASDYIKEFFATNTLAKIGAILIFLAVVFFLRGIAETFWEVIGPVGRLLIGFVIAFAVFGAGSFLHARGNKNEGLILIGLSILINYGVILSGRYLIGESSLGEDGFLTEGITFILLILNTVFGVVTSLVYQSRTLLIFSFVFAYINPFIIGASSSGTPYTLVGYSLIVSLGGLFLAQNGSTKSLVLYEINENNYNILLYITFILGSLLILVAPFTTNIDWIVKIISSVVLSIVTIYTFWNAKLDKSSRLNLGVTGLFIIAYVFIILLLMFGGSHQGIIDTGSSFIVYTLILLGFFGFTSVLFKNDSSNPILQFLLFIPLLICLVLILSGQAFSVLGLLIVILGLYLISFGTLQKHFSTVLSYVYFILIGLFILVADISLVIESSAHEISVFLTVLAVSFIFLFATYYYSLQKYLSHLYSIGTIFAIFLLAPIIVVASSTYGLKAGDLIQSGLVTTSLHVNLSIASIILFALANWILPFMNKNLLNNTKNITNLVVGSLAGVIFIAYELYNFGNAYFPGVAQGIAFLSLAVIYFVQSFLVVQKIGNLQSITSDSSENKAPLKNVFYTYAGISLSLFSLAIAFLFSKYPEIISTVWLFEATILYYFYSQTKQWKILTAGNVLFVIGIFKLGLLIDIVDSGDYNFLVSFSVIAVSLLLNVWFIDKLKDITGKTIHYVFHVIGIAILGLLLSQIIVSSGHGWSSFGISIFLTAIGVVYSLLKTDFLKGFFILLLIGFSIFHIASIEFIFNKLERDDINYFKALQYIVTTIVISNYFIWNRKINTHYKKIIISIIGVYTFIISNIYILDIFGDIFGHFSLTIYWGIIASVLLFYGIANDMVKLRTIGLYFIILTSVKIFGFDVWQLDNTSSRVIALMGLGILFIAISTLYTKKYGNNILNELNLDNLKDDDQDIQDHKGLLDTDSDNNSSDNTINSKTDNTDKIISNKKTNKTVVKKEKNKQEKSSKKKEKKSDESITKNSNEQLDSNQEEFPNDFMKKLSKVNVDDIKVVRFFPKNLDNFTIRAKNLMRVSKLVIKQTGKNSFASGELEGIYNYVIKNYKSKLSRREFDKLRTTLK